MSTAWNFISIPIENQTNAKKQKNICKPEAGLAFYRAMVINEINCGSKRKKGKKRRGKLQQLNRSNNQLKPSVTCI